MTAFASSRWTCSSTIHTASGCSIPIAPSPRQRNVVRHWSVGELDALPNERVIPAIGLYRRIGQGGRAHLRLLVCEGASLLSWIGTWQDEPYEERQRCLLAALVPDLQRRLVVERQLEQGGRMALMGAALEAIGAAAFVLAARGSIREANAAGRALLHREGRSLHDELRASCLATTGHARWVVTPVRTSAGNIEYLAILRARDEVDLASRVERAARRMGLTPRQRDVLGRLVEGAPTRASAHGSGYRPGRVEVHVTALLHKAQVASRAELVATVYTLD